MGKRFIRGFGVVCIAVIAGTLTGCSAAADTNPQTTAAEETAFEGTAYIKDVDSDNLSLDRAEWVEVPSERATELGITEDDAPSGFSVYNPEELTETFSLSPDCSITVLNWTNNYSSAEVTVDDFIRLLEDRGEQNTWIPYTVSVENGEIIEIVEHYVP